MSNALKRKRKKMQPLGYRENIHILNQQRIKREYYVKDLSEKTFLDMRLVSYQVLHDKFGFGQKRIQRLETQVNHLLMGELSCDQLLYYLGHDKEIDLQEVDIPERDLIGFEKIGYNNDILPLKEKLNIVLESVSDYIVLSVAALKTFFNFSKKQIYKYVDWICYYINSISQGFEDMTGIASVLWQECHYRDTRFSEKLYEI